ncbi:MAG TPA: PAS domain-containing protein, partial [Microthrixaceae bacterium]|nr:PAS domain-containing protein [Microthrixaceae bacterium]
MLSSSENILANAVDYLREGIWSLDPVDGVITDLSQPGAQTVGRDRDGLLGTTFRALLEPALSRAGWRLLLDQLTPETAHVIRSRMLHADGGSIPVELTFLLHPPTADGPGTRGSISVVSRDLTETILANESAASGYELLHTAFGASSEGIALVDAQGHFEYVNESFEALVDLPHERIVTLSVFDPPWSWIGPDNKPINPELTAESRSMRNGTPFASTDLRLRGTGRSRSTDQAV